MCAPSSQVLICVHDERTGGELHGASQLRKSETQALHLRHAWSGVSVSDEQKSRKVGYWVSGFCSLDHVAPFVDVCCDD